MMKPRLIGSVAFASLCLALPFSPALGGSGGQASAYSVEGDADREIVRRQQEIVRAEDALRRGDAALKAGNLEQAYLAYKEAVDLIPDAVKPSTP